MTFDLITMGRVSVDVYPNQVGTPLEDVETFGKYLGGSPTNVAVAAARYGRRTAVVTRTGEDPFGRFVHKALRGYGVDDRFVTAVPGLPTPLAFCEIFPPDDFPLYFYRYPKAPDLEIRPEELDLDAIRSARIVWATVTGLSQEPSREATLTALGEHPGQTVIDLDYRPMLWDDPSEAPHWAGLALERATVAVGNLEECEVAVGEREPRAAARAILARGPELAIVKMGPEGVLAATADEVVEVPPVKVDVVNGLGAGDAFGGAVCHGLLAGWGLRRLVEFAGAAGAIVASRIACSDAMPTQDEVDELLKEPR
ncbi:5-dehydro-2-deoxygluconokinase [Actinomadura coerulea]|uniref:5-dehydro-2-deoxygluconokinase n=1 Tax=Actinomadura coerulea TaxID=46159 RepID=A0A7X0KZ69_9ACTN|nr:5-dehydro-2-deoxygluconokinase [Actinomadura coerulea]MBB6396135.1 5-dehydro-2-deoxygluconokinase [Actinomadura coerulea]GGQ38380.1 5-dehydro-2-deoxygluconokinase [Actinomadura coerulea]